MILSHKNQFIFLHGQKTAGSSISVACNPYLGWRDVQVGIWPDIIRNGGQFNTKSLAIAARSAPRMCASTIKRSIQHRRIVSGFTVSRVHRTILRYYQDKAGFGEDPGHPTALQVKRYAPSAWHNYFRFTIVRNPWDRAVSFYYWHTRKLSPGVISFKEFLKRFNDRNREDPEGVRPALNTGWSLYTINDKIAVDYVVRFENLEEDIKLVSEKINIPLDSKLHIKSNTRDKATELRDHYDDENIEIVNQLFAKEIEYFGYRLPF